MVEVFGHLIVRIVGFVFEDEIAAVIGFSEDIYDTFEIGGLFDPVAWDVDLELRVYGVKNGSTTEMELGGYLRFQYKKDLAKNITFLTRGDLFSNYLRNPENIDVTWETLFTFKVNEWFAATLNTLLIYDNDTDLPKVDENNVPYSGPATQFKETLGIGVSFKL